MSQIEQLPLNTNLMAVADCRNVWLFYAQPIYSAIPQNTVKKWHNENSAVNARSFSLAFTVFYIKINSF